MHPLGTFDELIACADTCVLTENPPKMPNALIRRAATIRQAIF
jgi:hypothetical protein